MADFARIRQILDESVNGDEILGHGPFWRGISRDQFVALSIFGRQLVARRADGTFDADESNLVKALEGRAPFGSDLVPRPPGAIFRRMPDGYPPVSADRIREIRDWIVGGCPETEATLSLWFDFSGGPVDPSIHNAFWRDFDNWAMFHAQPPVPQDINAFFAIGDRWLDFARDNSLEPAWANAIVSPAVQTAVARLEARQRTTVVQHYGRPVPVFNLLDSFQRFGDNTLPDDPQRPQDMRHTMNGEIMWFFWAAFCDAAVRLSATVATIPGDFWRGMSRAVLVGVLNDGLFRGRFTVLGFSADAAGQQAIRQHAGGLADADLTPALAQRFRDSGL